MKPSLKCYILTLIISIICIGLACCSAFVADDMTGAYLFAGVALVVNIIGMSVSEDYAYLEYEIEKKIAKTEERLDRVNTRLDARDSLMDSRIKNNNKAIEILLKENIEINATLVNTMSSLSTAMKETKELKTRVNDLELKKIPKKKKK